MFKGFTFGQQATQAIESGKVRPFIAVFPPSSGWRRWEPSRREG